MRYVVLFLAILAAGLSFRLIPEAYVSSAGIVVEGKVTAKREAFLMTDGDRWQHVLEITYRYQPLDAPYPETASHQVAPALYSRLREGSPVQVRYSPSRLLRPMKGVGAVLADSSWLSRIPGDSGGAREAAEFAALVGAALLGFAAYKKNSRPLGLVAGVAGATVASAILLAGLIVFPILFWAWLRNRGKGFGWVLLASIALTTVVLYWRIPQPAPMPSGPQRDTAATVRRVREVDQLWNGWDSGGQSLRQPFQMADLEFTPEGASEPVHVLDRVDLGSLPGLKDGAAVPVSYALTDPRSARIQGGTRTYARQALVYILGVTFGVGAVLAFVVGPLLIAGEKLIRPLLATGESLRRISSLPADDPRRKALEKALHRRLPPGDGADDQ